MSLEVNVVVVIKKKDTQKHTGQVTQISITDILIINIKHQQP